MAILNRWTLIEDWNPNSHAQVKDYLRFKGYPIPKDRKDRTKETTGREELKKLYQTLLKKGIDDPVLPRVMLSTALSKGVGYLSDKFVGKDDRFHSDFRTTPKTNRVSAAEPNLTNQPQGKGESGDPVTQVKVEVAEAVRATIIPSDGMKLGKCDWKAAEAILLGYFAEDSVYMRLSRLGVYSYFIAHDPELGIKIPDLNQDDASLRKELDAIKSAHRARYDKMKSTALGIGYGEKVPMIAKQNGISWGEAKKYYDLFFRVAPKIRKFQNATKRRAQKEGYLINPAGYCLDYWDVLKYDPEHMNKDGSSGAWVDGSEANEALAFLPQSTLASMLKEVFLELEPYEVEGEFHLCVPCHDEVLMEAREDKFDHYAALVKRVMEKKWEWLGGMSLEAELEEGYVWMSCKKERHLPEGCHFMHPHNPTFSAPASPNNPPTPEPPEKRNP